MTYKYFTSEELQCKCGCNRENMDKDFMNLIDEMREELSIPFYVTSAYRCPEHNNNVSKTGYRGPHTFGRAIDIAASSTKKFKIVTKAIEKGINRIGIAKTFVHLDNLKSEDAFPERVIWSY